MDLEAIRVFLEVVRTGSFSAAARHRNVAPSSIARMIGTLENQIGVRLIERTTRRLTLTEGGERFHAGVLPLVEEFDRTTDAAVAVVRRPSGVLRLTASNAFGYVVLAPLIPAFRKAYPEISMELLLTDTNLDLVADRIDLAIRLGPVADASLVGTKLFTTRYCVCASSSYLRTDKTIGSPADISTRSCVLLSLPAFRRAWRFRDSEGHVTEIPVQGSVLTSSILTLREWAIMGMGPALLPHWLVEEDLETGRLRNLFPKYLATATEFDAGAWLLYPSRAYLPAKVRAMVDFLKRHVTQNRHRFGR